jgi:hypothetical protein
MARLTLLCTLITLAACSSETMPMAHGPWRQLNPGKWAFNENVLIEPPMGLNR